MEPGIRHLALYDENREEAKFPGYDRVAVRVEARDTNVRIRGMRSEDVVFPGLALFADQVACLAIVDPATGQPYMLGEFLGMGPVAPMMVPIPTEMVSRDGNDLVLREPVVRF